MPETTDIVNWVMTPTVGYLAIFVYFNRYCKLGNDHHCWLSRQFYRDRLTFPFGNLLELALNLSPDYMVIKVELAKFV